VQAVARPPVEAILYEGMKDLPHFNPDADVEPLHPAVASLRELLANCDAILFSTPEYAGALPGSFKNVLDWMVGSENVYAKPTAWVNVSSVAAPTGGADAHDSLRKILGYLNVRVLEQACLRLPLQRSDIGPDGLIAAPEIRAELLRILDSFAAQPPMS
jgi:chromate reductase, NAD(P)H dehydrogenase (quinone)